MISQRRGKTKDIELEYADIPMGKWPLGQEPASAPAVFSPLFEGMRQLKGSGSYKLEG